MTTKQVISFTNGDQALHTIISDIDEAIKEPLSEKNKAMVDQVKEHLLEAHGLIHDLDYSNPVDIQSPIRRSESEEKAWQDGYNAGRDAQ